MGRIIRCITSDGTVSVMACDSTDITARAKSIHNTTNVCTAALGRVLTAASMIGSMQKDDEDSITIRFAGGGPAGMVTAVAKGTGNVKGDIDNPDADVPKRADGHLNVGGVIGRDGTMVVIKDMGLAKPYIGQIPITTGEIAEDITSYYAVSEQTPTVCGLGVLVAPTGEVIVSGGFLIQLLPTADDSIIDRVEADIQNLRPVTAMLSDGLSLEEICKSLLPSFEIEPLRELHPQYKCECSREKTMNMLLTLGKKELGKMAFDSTTEVVCHFCGTKYRFTSEEILRLQSLCDENKNQNKGE